MQKLLPLHNAAIAVYFNLTAGQPGAMHSVRQAPAAPFPGHGMHPAVNLLLTRNPFLRHDLPVVCDFPIPISEDTESADS